VQAEPLSPPLVRFREYHILIWLQDDSKPLLSDVFNAVGVLKDSPIARLVDRAGADILQDRMFDKSRGSVEYGNDYTSLLYFLGGVVIVGGGVTVVRGWKSRRLSAKKGRKLY
jgi:hypothetical protein